MRHSHGFGDQYTECFRRKLSAIRRSSAAIGLAACLVGVATCTGLANDSLGVVRLQVQKVGEEAIKPDTSPRLAVFLVDCSSSMENPVRPGTVNDKNPPRRHAVHDGLRKCLEQLAKDSPGIEVRVRFFNERLLDKKVTCTLDDPAKVNEVMKQIPREFELAPGTHLYDATCTLIEDMLVEHKTRAFGWMFFGLFSDGEDQKSTRHNVNDHNAAIAKFQKAGPGFVPVVWPVGPEADKLAAGGKAFGPAKILKLDQAIPKPPPPRPTFRLVPAANQSTDLPFKRLATHGPATLSFSVEGPPEVLGVLRTGFRVDARTPYRLETQSGKGFESGPVTVDLDLPDSADVAKGVAVSVTADASALADAPCVIEGNPTFTFTFLSTKTLDPKDWVAEVPPVVRKGSPAACSVNPGELTEPTWTFTRPESEPVVVKGLRVEPVLPKGGSWKVQFGGTADTGTPLSKDFGVIEVIDADFAIQPAAVAVPAGKPATVKIVPVPGAAEARYACSLAGQRVDAVLPEVTIPASQLQTIGRHMLSITAQSAKGGFKWTHDATVDVLFAPRIEILSVDYREGPKEAVANVYVAGDLGDAVLVRVDTGAPKRVPVIYDNPAQSDRSTQIRFNIPATEVGRTFELEVAPEKPDACPPAKLKVEGRPADVWCRLKFPVDGSTVIASPPQTIEIEPAGDDFNRVGEVAFTIGFRRSGEAREIEEGPTATRSSNWKFALPPDLSPGPLEIHAKPVGGGLRPDVFPSGKSWKQIGTLHVPPPIPWISLVGADPPSPPPASADDASVLGPVRPGKVAGLTLVNVPAKDVARVAWTLGPFENDPEYGSAIARSGGKEFVTCEVTPQAWGVFPAVAALELSDGTAVPRAVANLRVEGVPIVAMPVLDTPAVKAKRASRERSDSKRVDVKPDAQGGNPGDGQAVPTFNAGTSALIFHPGIEGDFRRATVAVFDPTPAVDAKPFWSQEVVQGTDTVRIPVAALPGIRTGERSRRFDIHMTIEPYPGDPLDPPVVTPIPFDLLPPKRWLAFFAIWGLLGFGAWRLGRLFIGNELRAGEFVYDFELLPNPNEQPRALGAKRLRLDGKDTPGDAGDGVSARFAPWSVFTRQARIPLGFLAQLAEKQGDARGQWILDRAGVSNHTLLVLGSWRDPVQHVGDTDNVETEPPPQLGLALEQAVWPAVPLGTTRVSQTQRLYLATVADQAQPSVYYRLYWYRYRDPLAWLAWAVGAIWLVSSYPLALLCNLLPR